MKSISITIISLFLTFFALNSCQNPLESARNKGKDDKEINKSDSSNVVLAIDSNAIDVVKTDFKVTKDVKPATEEEINEMVSDKKAASLNDYQNVVQSFFEACAVKDYDKVGSLLAYNGKKKKRKLKDHYNMTDPNEVQIVKSTVDVIYGFLEESKDYDFITYSEKSTAKGTYATMEVSFFKKGMGINRRQFDVADTPKGMLIVDMR